MQTDMRTEIMPGELYKKIQSLNKIIYDTEIRMNNMLGYCSVNLLHNFCMENKNNPQKIHNLAHRVYLSMIQDIKEEADQKLAAEILNIIKNTQKISKNNESILERNTLCQVIKYRDMMKMVGKDPGLILINQKRIKHPFCDSEYNDYKLDIYLEYNGRKLDIETDGEQHKHRKHEDFRRDKCVREEGISVLRLRNRCGLLNETDCIEIGYVLTKQNKIDIAGRLSQFYRHPLCDNAFLKFKEDDLIYTGEYYLTPEEENDLLIHNLAFISEYMEKKKMAVCAFT